MRESEDYMVYQGVARKGHCYTFFFFDLIFFIAARYTHAIPFFRLQPFLRRISDRRQSGIRFTTPRLNSRI